MDNKKIKGRIKRWNDDKGFGFISSESRKRDVFIHISALKTMSRRPIVGDIILYQIHTDNSGKNRAVNARIEGVVAIKPRVPRTKSTKNNLFYPLFLLVLFVFVGLLLFNNFSKMKGVPEVISNSSVFALKQEVVKEYEEFYSCEGKVYCSEMTSCEEAMFYQANCLGTKMDGDKDGIPCESQWCGRW